MVDLLSLVPDAARAALAEWLAERDEPAYRARQVFRRLWERPVESWDDATELPAALRRALAAALPLRRLPLSARQVSRDGTEKYLWDLGDGEAVESVLIPEGKRRTLCISSQVGCALGCVFCATGRMGFRRNLSVAEIACQVREVMLLDAALKPTNVVFMGMGEPLLNWDAVRRAHDSQPPGGTRDRGAAHHGLDRGHPAEPRQARATARAVSAGPLAARAVTGAAA